MNPSKVKILCKECGRSFTTIQSRTAHEQKCEQNCKPKAVKPICSKFDNAQALKPNQPTTVKQNVVVNEKKKVEPQNMARSDSSTMAPSELSRNEAPLGLPVTQVVPSWLALYEEYKGETNRKQIVRMVYRLVP